LSRWLYGVSKATDEFLALAYARERQLPVTIVRLFNTTGARQTGRYGMVVPRFVQQAIAGQPITVFGDGSQQRCFTSVHDVVTAMTRIATTDASVGQVVNIGNPREISIRELAELIRTLCGSRSQVEYVGYTDAYGEGFEDMRRRVPDVSRLVELTGFAPQIPLEEVIAELRDEALRTERTDGARIGRSASGPRELPPEQS
jgi:UDP-glucose 4-epimerase